MEGVLRGDKGRGDMRKLAVGITAVALLLGVSGTAAAHVVGTPGEPNCFGERVSHGNWPKDEVLHSITPVERAAFLTFIIAEFPADPFAQLLESLFGEDVSVAEFTAWVKLNCEAP